MAFKKIKEYIDRDVGTAGTLLIPQLILPELMKDLDKQLIPRELAAKILSGFPGSTINQNQVNEDSLAVRQVGEGAEVPLDAIGFSNIVYTPVKFGVAIRITREMIEDSQFDLLSENIRTAGQRFADNENSLVLTALDGTANDITGGASLTIANLVTAMTNLRENGYSPSDMIIGFEALGDLQQIDTFVEANKAGDAEFLKSGFRGNIFGMQVHTFDDRASPTPGTYTKYAYVLDRAHTYGIALKRDISMEKVMLPTYDMEGAVITQRIDVQLLRSNAVSRITTT